MSASYKILVRCTNWLGDALLSLPALQAVKEFFPEYSLSVLTKAHLADLYGLCPAIDGVFSLEKASGWKGLRAEQRMASLIKKEGFELCFIFPSSFHSAVVPFLAGIPVRIGYRKNARSFLLTHPYPARDDYKRKVHQARFYIDLVEQFCRRTCGGKPLALEIPEGLKPQVFSRLESLGFRGGSIVGLSPGAEYGPAKRWPLTGWHMLISKILHETQHTVVITGMPSDKEAAQFLKDSTGDRVIDATGALSLREFFGLLSLCTAFVANDSGAMHAASAAGAPVVGIFGSTSPDATHPVSGMYKIVKRDISCSPCFERECRFGHYQCLTEIQPEDVFEAMREFL